MRSAKELLEKMFDSETAGKAGVYTKLFGSWSDLVGERLASHTRIIELKGSTLIIEADHSSWVQLIQFNSKKYLQRLNAMYPSLEINAISIFCRHSAPSIPVKCTEPVILGKEEDYRMESSDILEKTEDAELKTLLERIQTAVTKRNTDTR